MLVLLRFVRLRAGLAESSGQSLWEQGASAGQAWGSLGLVWIPAFKGLGFRGLVLYDWLGLAAEGGKWRDKTVSNGRYFGAIS